MVESRLRSWLDPKMNVFSIFRENSCAFLEIIELLSTFFSDCKKNHKAKIEMVKTVNKPCIHLALVTNLPSFIAESAMPKDSKIIKKNAYFSMGVKIENTFKKKGN